MSERGYLRVEVSIYCAGGYTLDAALEMVRDAVATAFDASSSGDVEVEPIESAGVTFNRDDYYTPPPEADP